MKHKCAECGKEFDCGMSEQDCHYQPSEQFNVFCCIDCNLEFYPE